MCHGFCWAAHLDAALRVCRSLRNKLARVGIRSLLQHNPRARERLREREFAAPCARASLLCPQHTLFSCAPHFLWQLRAGVRDHSVISAFTRLTRHRTSLLFRKTASFPSLLPPDFWKHGSGVSMGLHILKLLVWILSYQSCACKTRWSYDVFVTCNDSTHCHLFSACWPRIHFLGDFLVRAQTIRAVLYSVTMMRSVQLFLWTLSDEVILTFRKAAL